MDNPFLEQLWDQVLSREPDSIRAAYAALDQPSQNEVRRHLERMVQEDGWHPEQRKSALAALNALETRADAGDLSD